MLAFTTRLMAMSLAALPIRAAASQDTTAARRDTTTLRPLEIRVTRAPEAADRVGATVGVVDSAAFRGARLQNGIDEALGGIPGIYVANRFNPSLDQRLSIRGAGARANFGIRGLRILLDGIPQTLPDGQSQLTNVDFGLVDRAEVLLGASSALYGNAGGGVIAFETALPAGPATGRVRALAGSFGTSRLSAQLAGTQGLVSGSAAVSRYQSGGFRQHSATESTQLSLGANRVFGGTWLLKGRYYLTDAPRAENPGSLTMAEYLVQPDSAAPNNIRRGADKAVRQHQVGVTLAEDRGDGSGFEATVFGLSRDLVNPLATAPPGPAGPTVGTYSAIDRLAGGARASWRRRLDRHGTKLGLGVDFQSMRDDRINRRSQGGLPTDTVVADQRERVTEFGPFVSLHLEPTERLTLSATTRYDRVRFSVADRYLADGSDQSGTKSMNAASASAGANWLLGTTATVYGNLATAFETPTTTELVSLASGAVGLNGNLGPQRTVTAEAGIRTSGRIIRGSVAVYRSAIHDALVQAREQDGRAFFENAGRLTIQGVEVGLDWRPAPGLSMAVAYGHTDAKFSDYRVRTGVVVDTLDGLEVPGIPRHVLRGTIAASVGALSVEWEQQIISQFFADDRNTVPIDGLGAGVSTVRIRAALPRGLGLAVAPFLSVANLWDKRYLAAATVNGFGGRVFEPAPGRWFHIGLDASFRLQGR